MSARQIELLRRRLRLRLAAYTHRVRTLERETGGVPPATVVGTPDPPAWIGRARELAARRRRRRPARS